MKKVTVYFKSGNLISFKAKNFEMSIKNDIRYLIVESPNFEAWMFDPQEIECYIIRP